MDEIFEKTSERLKANILRLMKRDDVNAAKICEKLKISSGAVSHWFKGEATPNYKQIDGLVKHFKWSLEELFLSRDDRLSAAIKEHNESNSPFKISLK